MTNKSEPEPSSPAAQPLDVETLRSLLAAAPSRIPQAQQVIPQIAGAITELVLRQGYDYRAVARLLTGAGLPVKRTALERLHLKAIERAERRKVRAKLKLAAKKAEAKRNSSTPAATTSKTAGETRKQESAKAEAVGLVAFVHVEGKFEDAAFGKMGKLGFRYMKEPRGFAPTAGQPVPATPELVAYVATMKATIEYTVT